MPKMTREQYDKWSSALSDGWKFAAQHYIVWGEKEIYTDGEADERGIFYRATLKYYEEHIGTGWTAKSTGKQIPTIIIDRYTPTGTGELYNVVQVFNEAAAGAEKKKNYNVLARLSASLDVAEYFKRAAEADTGTAYNTMFDFSEPTDEQNAPETGETVTDTTEETDAAEAQENGASDTAINDPAESAEDTKQSEESAPDMFATLAAAYISGRTIKREPKEEPTAAEEAQEPEEVKEEPPHDGYDKTSDFFAADEMDKLAAGVPVMRKARYNNSAYFTAPYSEGVRLIYYVSSYDERDTVNPGNDAKFWGVLIGGMVYGANSKAISAKLTEDINRFLLDYVKSEEDAAHAAANVDKYQRGRINEAKEQDYSGEARRAFFDHKPPMLTLYYRDSSYTYKWDELISYLQAPEQAIEAAALRYLCKSPGEVYISYIHYNRLSTLYEAIKSDIGNEEHNLLKISDCVTSQKSVRVELANGHEVKVDADTIKRFKYTGYISPWNVAACDRKYLPKDERGHDDNIRASDIVTISHGGRVLYRAA